MSDSTGRDYVLHRTRETGIGLIRLWFADVAGRLNEVTVAAERLGTVLDTGLGVDGGVMGGPTQDESELFLVPDPSTFVLMPSSDAHPGMARMFCDVQTASGHSAPDDTRAVLKGSLDRAAARGFTFYVGAEIEHFYVRDDGSTLEPMDRMGRYHPGAADEMGPMEGETLEVLEQLGVGVDWFHHEDAPGQYKVGLQYRDALSMGDGLLTYGQVVRQIARRHGLAATFMPKPFTEREGSGLHFTLSLMSGEDNVFSDGANPLGLSDVARQFIAGLLCHGRDITLVTNPTVNSYKRLVPGFAAPTRCTWADSGRGDLVRIPAFGSTDSSPSCSLEYRVADPSCNPYLALAAVLEAGLDGIDQSLAPPPRRTHNEPLDATPLPTHLWEAIAAAAGSDLLRRVLGEALHDRMLAAATDEWRAYHRQVSQWELENYLR